MELLHIKAKTIWKNDLFVTDVGVESEQQDKLGGNIYKKYVPFEQIAQVDVTYAALAASIEITNTGGVKTISVFPLKKDDARKFEELVNSKIRSVKTAEV